jgi:2-isopropylmalate synthase
MDDVSQTIKITIFDTTLRDGELALKRKLTVEQKIRLAIILDKMGVDAIEVGYPGAFHKDCDEIFRVSQQVKNSTICSQYGSVKGREGSTKPGILEIPGF